MIGMEIRCFRISAWRSARICSLCRSRRNLICSFSELWRGISLTFGICKSFKLFHNGSPRSVTYRRRLTGRQTFVLRVISSSTARIFFSLLGEQWWREHHADGDVIVLEVIEGPVLAWGFLDVRFSCLRECGSRWAHNLWEGPYSARVPRSSLAGVHKRICPPKRGRWSWWPRGKTRW